MYVDGFANTLGLGAGAGAGDDALPNMTSVTVAPLVG
jgi:hypothetical protein